MASSTCYQVISFFAWYTCTFAWYKLEFYGYAVHIATICEAFTNKNSSLTITQTVFPYHHPDYVESNWPGSSQHAGIRQKFTQKFTNMYNNPKLRALRHWHVLHTCTCTYKYPLALYFPFLLPLLHRMCSSSLTSLTSSQLYGFDSIPLFTVNGISRWLLL